MHPLIQHIFKTTVTFALILCSSLTFAESKADITQMLTDVNKMHQDFSKSYYRALLKQPQYKTAKFPSLNMLQQALKKEQEQRLKVALIVNNRNMLKDYYDDPQLLPLIEILLQNNEFNSASILLDSIKDQGDDTLYAQAEYLLAGYYFKREEWDNTLQELKNDMSFLSNTQYQHTLLMKGVALQKLSQHYQAIKVYEKVPSSSDYYTEARLNLAIANLRQGWWTDAHIIIKERLKAEQEAPQEAILNRLYITLAYSLLNQGYYRTARSTFHQVGINSDYANQAILGIALTAAQQNDDIGALNATRFLKARTQDELPVDEAHLLMPFFYEKSHQLVAASVGYSEATDYYTAKIARLNRALKSPLNLQKETMPVSKTITFNIADNVLDYSRDYPRYFFENRLVMQAFQASVETRKLQKKYDKLSQAYEQLTVSMSKQILQTRIDNLNSYLNQSRFGLARLFDNNTVEQ